MRKLAAIVVVVAGVVSAGLAFGGTRSWTSLGAQPNDAGQGVDLSDVVGCRMSAYLTDGGTIGGGTLQWWYSDPPKPWSPGDAVFDCARTAGRYTLDGGSPSVFVCPDLEPLARYGKVAAVAINLTSGDGGVATGAVVESKCWGPTVNGPNL